MAFFPRRQIVEIELRKNGKMQMEKEPEHWKAAANEENGCVRGADGHFHWNPLRY